MAETIIDEVVRLEGVCRHYSVGEETVKALDSVSFTITKGGYWAIMGPSGSGKSTLLNILGCLDRPTAGAYWLNGENTATMEDNALSDHRLKNLGFVFQSFHLIPQLTVVENIEMPMFYLGVSPKERRQRVAVARALANDPAVLLADEPTGNLDSATSVQIMQLFQELHEQGKTVILVTHEPDIAAYAKSHIVVKDGHIQSYEP